MSAVSNVCGKELAVVSVVSFRGSDPPALVLSVSGEVVGGCCEAAVAPVSAKKFALQAKSAVFGQFWRCWANFFACGR